MTVDINDPTKWVRIFTLIPVALLICAMIPLWFYMIRVMLFRITHDLPGIKLAAATSALTFVILVSFVLDLLTLIYRTAAGVPLIPWLPWLVVPTAWMGVGAVVLMLLNVKDFVFTPEDQVVLYNRRKGDNADSAS